MLKAFFFLILSLFAASAFAQEIPADETGFTKAAAERIQHELSDYSIHPAGSLTVEGKRADGESTGQINLDRIYAFCQRDQSNCNDAMNQFASGIGEAIREKDLPIDKSMVRLVIRPNDYVEGIRKQMGSGQAALFSRPIAPGLSVIPVLDYTRTVRFVGEKDLVKLGVKEDDLFEIGRQNLESTTKPFAEVAPVPVANSFGIISDEDYASSRMIFHEEWGEIAKKVGGNLVVMLPAPDTILYGDGSSNVGIDVLRTFARNVANQSTRPLTLSMWRWTPSGWDEVQEDDRN